MSARGKGDSSSIGTTPSRQENPATLTASGKTEMRLLALVQIRHLRGSRGMRVNAITRGAHTR